MAIEGQHSQVKSVDLNDEADLSEGALDGVVGGTAGPTPASATNKDPASELASLLHDAAAANYDDQQLTKMEASTNGVPSSQDEHNLKTSMDKLVQGDATKLADLSSHLSSQQMGAVMVALGHVDQNMSGPEASSRAQSILANGESVADASTNESANIAATYLREEANSAVMQEHRHDTAPSGAGGHVGQSHFPITQTLDAAMDIIAESKARLFDGPSSLFSSQQLHALEKDGEKVTAKTTEGEISSDAQAIARMNPADGSLIEDSRNWGKITGGSTELSSGV